MSSKSQRSGSQPGEPGMDFWIWKYTLMILGWDPPSFRYVLIFAGITAVYIQFMHWSILSAVLSWAVIISCMMSGRLGRLLITAGEIIVISWVSPVYFASCIFNNAVICSIFLFSLWILPGFSSEVGTRQS